MKSYFMVDEKENCFLIIQLGLICLTLSESVCFHFFLLLIKLQNIWQNFSFFNENASYLCPRIRRGRTCEIIQLADINDILLQLWVVCILIGFCAFSFTYIRLFMFFIILVVLIFNFDYAGPIGLSANQIRPLGFLVFLSPSFLLISCYHLFLSKVASVTRNESQRD